MARTVQNGWDPIVRPSGRSPTKSWWILLVSVGWIGVSVGVASENPIFDQLVTTGVSVSPQTSIRLRAPTLTDGMSREAQRQAIEAIAGTKHRWEALTRAAVVAPFALQTQFEHPSHNTARQIDLWFVVRGELSQIADEDFLRQQLEANDSTDQSLKSHHLTPIELQQRRIEPVSDDHHFLAVDMTLLERVRIRATTETMLTKTADSVILASRLATSFDQDQDHPNAWQAISRDAAGKPVLGPPQSYSGMGSYVKATRLVEPPGSLLVEYHLVFNEPDGWFKGTNLLRSKIPLLSQDGVRSLRRKLQPR